ncbi:MAG: hypothetical protein LBR89_01675 [Holosporales bacterium]|jgi:hypothetical protein|nr:hypothetical protein [Holosporales bacterium]
MKKIEIYNLCIVAGLFGSCVSQRLYCDPMVLERADDILGTYPRGVGRSSSHFSVDSRTPPIDGDAADDVDSNPPGDAEDTPSRYPEATKRAAKRAARGARAAAPASLYATRAAATPPAHLEPDASPSPLADFDAADDVGSNPSGEDEGVTAEDTPSRYPESTKRAAKRAARWAARAAATPASLYATRATPPAHLEPDASPSPLADLDYEALLHSLGPLIDAVNNAESPKDKAKAIATLLANMIILSFEPLQPELIERFGDYPRAHLFIKTVIGKVDKERVSEIGRFAIFVSQSAVSQSATSDDGLVATYLAPVLNANKRMDRIATLLRANEASIRTYFREIGLCANSMAKEASQPPVKRINAERVGILQYRMDRDAAPTTEPIGKLNGTGHLADAKTTEPKPLDGNASTKTGRPDNKRNEELPDFSAKKEQSSVNQGEQWVDQDEQWVDQDE